MRKKMLALVVVGAIAAFAGGALYSVAEAGRGCLNCKKDGCPRGYCYVDCGGCCFDHPDYGLVCFR